MRFNLQLALRNLRRNLRRTLLSLAIIALGTAMSFAVRGYVENALFNIRNGTVEQYGHFQIAAASLFDDEAEGYDYLIQPDVLATVQGILAQHPEVVAETAQLNFSALASFGRKTKVLRVTATEPGNRALDYNDLVVKGGGLQKQDRNKALVGNSLATAQHLEPGKAFRVNLSTVDGAFNVGTLEVAGIFSLNSAAFEGSLAFVPIGYAQALLNTTGVGKVIVKLDRLEYAKPVAAAVRQELRAAGLDLDVRTWEQLSQFYRQIKGFFNALFFFLTLSISVLVFFIVLQVLTMAFLERTREVGTIRALGTKRRQVFSLFLTEGVLLGVLGGGAGVALGWLISIAFNAMGVSWTPPGAIDPVTVRIVASPNVALIPFSISALATLFSALYPAVHSARVSIVDALRAT